MGLNLRSFPKNIPDKQNPWIAVGLILLASLFLMVCVAAPSAFASSSAPEERAMLLARFIWVVASLTLAMILGRWVRQKVFAEKTAGFVFAIWFFLVSISILLMLVIPTQKIFEPVYPEIRNWLMENPWSVLCLVSASLLTIFLITRWLKTPSVFGKLSTFMLLIMIILSSLGSLVSVYSALPKVQLRAKLWDWRDARIQAAIQKGRYEIVLPALDSIAGVTELQAETDHWVNNCAELFYGMKSIQAIEPVMTRLPDS